MSKPYPLVEDVEKVESKDGDKLLAALDEALRGKDQRRAAAVASRYGELGHDARAIFAKLRQADRARLPMWLSVWNGGSTSRPVSLLQPTVVPTSAGRQVRARRESQRY